VFLLLLDLDLRSDSLLSFLGLLIEYSKESPEFAAARFYVGFVSQHVSFCQFTPGSLRFCFVPSIEDFSECERSFESHAEYLLVAATHANSFLKMTASKDGPLNELFRWLSQVKVMDRLLDIVYVLSGEVAGVDCESNARIHLIHVASEPSEKNVQFALKANAEYFLEPKISVNTLQSFKACLGQAAINAQMRIFCSPTLSVKSAHGPVRQFAVKARQTVINLRFFSRAVPPFLVLQRTRESVDCVSIQMVLDVFDGDLFVLNRAWKLATGTADWSGSIDPAWSLAPFIQMKAATQFKDMGFTTPWVIAERKWKFRPNALTGKKLTECMERFVNMLLDPGIFTDGQRAYFMLVGFYGGNGYYGQLYDALKICPADGPYLVIPPFLVYSEEEAIGRTERPICEMPPIRIPVKRYARLLNALQSFKNET
jgi:hypothetical protein